MKISLIVFIKDGKRWIWTGEQLRKWLKTINRLTDNEILIDHYFEWWLNAEVIQIR